MNPDKYYVNITDEGYTVTKAGRIEARFMFKQNAEEYAKARNNEERLPDLVTGAELIAAMKEKFSNADQQESTSIPAGIQKTLAEREKTHGDFSANADIAQILKNVFRGNCKEGWTNMPPEVREALDMFASKICRILSGGYNYIDNWHDIQGYAALVEKYLEDKQSTLPYNE